MNKGHEKTFQDLKSSRYFRHAPDALLSELIGLAETSSFLPGETIIRQGEPTTKLYIISDGEVSVKVDGEPVYCLKRRGDIFGDMAAAGNEQSSATVEARGRVQVIAIGQDAIERIQLDSGHELHQLVHAWLTRVLAEKLALATQKAKRYEKLLGQLKAEMETAKFVQQALCSANLKTIPGFSVFLKSEFADILGGDVYGIFEVDQGRFGILIGDASGHGAPAALIAMSVLNSFQHFSKGERSSMRVLHAVNDLAQQSMPANRFLTAFYGIVDAETRELVYTNAGHHPALLLRENRVQRLPMSHGIPIGIHQSHLAGYTEQTFRLERGDRLILFTDGVFEIGERRITNLSELERFLESHAQFPSHELTGAVFGYGNPRKPTARSDDFTFLIFETH